MASTIFGVGAFFLSDSSCGICLASLSKKHFELVHKLGFRKIFVIPSNYENENSLNVQEYSSVMDYIKSKASLKCMDVAKKICLNVQNPIVNLNFNMGNHCINYNYVGGSINYNYSGGGINYSINNNNVQTNYNTISGGSKHVIQNSSNGYTNYISNNCNSDDTYTVSQTVINNNNGSNNYSVNSITNNNNNMSYTSNNINNNCITTTNNNNNGAYFQGNSGKRACNPHVVLGSHTVVEVEGEFLEKPRNYEDAYNMLKKLSNKSHDVHTAVAICTQKSGCDRIAVLFVESTKVLFQELHDVDIKAYLNSEKNYLNHVAGYSADGLGSQLIQSVEGCFYNVGGLPLARISTELAALHNDNLICNC